MGQMDINEIIRIVFALAFAGVALWGIREMNIMLNPPESREKK